MENPNLSESNRIEPTPLIPLYEKNINLLSWGVSNFQRILVAASGLLIGNTLSYALHSTQKLQGFIESDIVRGAGVIGYFGSVLLIRGIINRMRFHHQEFLDQILLQTSNLHIRRREAILFVLSDYFYFTSLGITGAVLQNSGIVLLNAITK